MSLRGADKRRSNLAYENISQELQFLFIQFIREIASLLSEARNDNLGNLTFYLR